MTHETFHIATSIGGPTVCLTTRGTSDVGRLAEKYMQLLSQKINKATTERLDNHFLSSQI